jgi:hypothetical protein
MHPLRAQRVAIPRRCAPLRRRPLPLVALNHIVERRRRTAARCVAGSPVGDCAAHRRSRYREGSTLSPWITGNGSWLVPKRVAAGGSGTSSKSVGGGRSWLASPTRCSPNSMAVSVPSVLLSCCGGRPPSTHSQAAIAIICQASLTIWRAVATRRTWPPLLSEPDAEAMPVAAAVASRRA